MAKDSGWGVLVALGNKSQEAKHLNRSLDKKEDVTTAELEAGDISLSLVKTIVGRMLMNAEGTARAANQVGDILIDVPSGASWSSEVTHLVGWFLARNHTAQIQKYTTNATTTNDEKKPICAPPPLTITLPEAPHQLPTFFHSTRHAPPLTVSHPITRDISLSLPYYAPPFFPLSIPSCVLSEREALRHHLRTRPVR